MKKSYFFSEPSFSFLEVYCPLRVLCKNKKSACVIINDYDGRK
jgi:hypothetical protein